MIDMFIFSVLDYLEIFCFFKYLNPLKSRKYYICIIAILIFGSVNYAVSSLTILSGFSIEMLLLIIEIGMLITCFKDFKRFDILIVFFLDVISSIEAVCVLAIAQLMDVSIANLAIFPYVIHFFRIILYIVFAMIIKKFITNYGYQALRKLFFIMIPIVILMLMLFEGFFIFGTDNYYCLILLASIIVGLSIFVIIKRQYIIESENEKLKMVNKILGYSNEQHQILEEKAKEVRKIKHDIVNNLSVIQSLFNENKNEEGLQYLENLIGDANKTVQTTIIKYPYLNALFNFKKYKFDDIKFVYEIGDIELSKVMEFDCCTILSNLLDNAIEEINRCSSNDRTIKLKLKDQSDTIIIMVSNAYHQQKSLNTEKQNKNEHGMGLTIVNAIVKKYNGELIIEQDKLFKVQLFLKK